MHPPTAPSWTHHVSFLPVGKMGLVHFLPALAYPVISLHTVLSSDFPAHSSPGTPLHLQAFAGKECARALALMKVDAAECNDNLSDLTDKQLQTLQDWVRPLGRGRALHVEGQVP